MRKNISVIAKMKENGMVTPLSVIWEDERIFNIDKVLDVRKQASLKGGGLGIRYTCRIGSHEKYLWLDGYIWFVEVDTNSKN